MTLNQKRLVIAVLGLIFLGSLVLVQWHEVSRRAEEAGTQEKPIAVPETSQNCVDCHSQMTSGIVSHWTGSTHARKGVGCYDCHKAEPDDIDGFDHQGQRIATIVTPKDCSQCHGDIVKEFSASHHAAAGSILHSLDNFLAETVEGAREPFNTHSPTPGRDSGTEVNGMASAFSGCHQCHGSKVALQGKDGSRITVDQLKLDDNGKPTNMEAVALIDRYDDGRPKLHASGWPNSGMGRINLDGSKGACSACHSRHDFSPRRARQPENCGKCHLGPDHPQKEIYEESKHGVAYRDLLGTMKLDGASWILGQDYSQAPTCATCHMSGNSKNGGKITHDPRTRISWNNRPPISVMLDTDESGKEVTETDPEKRRALTVDSWVDKRNRMKQVCSHCHSPQYIDSFYRQYDDLVVLYNEKFAKPGKKIVDTLLANGLLTKKQFDEEIEWTWFYLWHHEGRRARHGVAMMAPDYTHWHGMYEVADRFYVQLIPQARELAHRAELDGKDEAAANVYSIVDEILARPEHQWAEGLPESKPRGDKARKPREDKPPALSPAPPPPAD
jgi:hydroxylamine dehydrogenase